MKRRRKHEETCLGTKGITQAGNSLQDNVKEIKVVIHEKTHVRQATVTHEETWKGT